MLCTTSGRQGKTSLPSDTSTQAFGKAVKSRMMVRPTCTLWPSNIWLILKRQLGMLAHFYDLYVLYLNLYILLAGEVCRSFIDLTPGDTQGELCYWNTHVIFTVLFLRFFTLMAYASTCCRCALAVCYFWVYIYWPAGDGLLTDVPGSHVLP